MGGSMMERPQLVQRIPVPLLPEEVAAIPIRPDDRAEWESMGEKNNHGPLAVELDGFQWTVVLATLRVGMAMSGMPGLERLAHDAIYAQVVDHETGGLT